MRCKFFRSLSESLRAACLLLVLVLKKWLQYCTSIYYNTMFPRSFHAVAGTQNTIQDCELFMLLAYLDRWHPKRCRRVLAPLALREQNFIASVIKHVLLEIHMAYSLLIIMLCIHPIIGRNLCPFMHVISHEIRIANPFSFKVGHSMLQHHS